MVQEARSVHNRAHDGFVLTKWYLDCAAGDGRVLIAYWASLAWHKVAVTWQSVAWFDSGGSRSQRSGLAATPPPQFHENALIWPNMLGGKIHVEPRLDPIELRLHQSAHGTVDWCAMAPAALIATDFGERGKLSGPGYVERIVMTIPPWYLPIRELRWGRWIDAAASRSVVWIDWRGDDPQTRVFVDGDCVADAMVTDEHIAAAGMRLTIGNRTMLHSAALAEIVAAVPPLRAVIPAKLLAVRQSRWLSAATRTDGSCPPVAGHAIHEVVLF